MDELSQAPRALADPQQAATRAIPVSGERIPMIGLGTWIVFNVGAALPAQAPLVPVMQTFFERGGGMIDSSPMYGTSESVIGDLLARVPNHTGLFAATKIWTLGRAAGARQLETSLKLW